MLRSAILGTVALLFASGVQAGEIANQSAKYSIWLPDAWIVSQKGTRLDAHNPKDTIQVVVLPLKDSDADVTDEDVTDVADDELDDMKVTKDSKAVHQGLQARRVEGTGTDEDDDVEFHELAVDPGGTAPVIVALVYGETEVMGRENAQRMVNRILESLKVTKAAQ